MKIYKYPLALALNPSITMPEGSEVLSVGIQHGIIMMWAKVDLGAFVREYHFYITGTGGDVPDNTKYIGTVQQGVYVWHVFQCMEDGEE